VRAQRGSLTGELGCLVRVGEERKEGERREGADAWDRPGRGRKEKRALGLGKRGEVGPASWAAWREGSGEGNGLPGERKAGPREGGEREQVGLLGWTAFSSFFPFLLCFFFSTLKPFKQIYMN
jgi:hypothetical protein